MDPLGVAIILADKVLRDDMSEWGEADDDSYELYKLAQQNYTDIIISLAFVFGQKIVKQKNWPFMLWFPVSLSLSCKIVMDGVYVSDMAYIVPLSNAVTFCETHFKDKWVVVSLIDEGDKSLFTHLKYASFVNAHMAKLNFERRRDTTLSTTHLALFYDNNMISGNMKKEHVNWFMRVAMLRHFEYEACKTFYIFDAKQSAFLSTNNMSCATVFYTALLFRNAFLLFMNNVDLQVPRTISTMQPQVTVVDDDVIYRMMMTMTLNKFFIDPKLVETISGFDIKSVNPDIVINCDDENKACSTHVYLLDMEDELSDMCGVQVANRLYQRDPTAIIAFVTAHDVNSEYWRDLMKQVDVPYISSYNKESIVQQLPKILRFAYI